MRPARAADAVGAGGAPGTSSVSASATGTSIGAGAPGAASGEVASASVSASSGAGASGSSSGEVASVGASSSSSSGVGGSGQGGAPPACAPGSEEACYEGPAGTEGVGACKAGVRACTETGAWGACIGQVTPAEEICFDDVDQDCDGQTEPPACCGGGTTECTDGFDNDGDGLVDSWDPECTGPLDHDEDSFWNGVLHDDICYGCTLDCGFDWNPGKADDECFADLRCDPAEPNPKCPFDPGAAACAKTQGAACIGFCLPITPNGCDCFGCCDVFLPDGTSRVIQIRSGCSFEDATSPSPQQCPACTKDPSCDNPIEPCEYGIGKTKLPPECAPPATNGCAEGQAACTPAQACPCGEYCLTGCCIKIPQ